MTSKKNPWFCPHSMLTGAVCLFGLMIVPSVRDAVVSVTTKASGMLGLVK